MGWHCPIESSSYPFGFRNRQRLEDRGYNQPFSDVETLFLAWKIFHGWQVDLRTAVIVLGTTDYKSRW